jgi:AhpD family alkylhydroperoxidase
MLDEKIEELIAIGATITANCQSCLEYHVGKAREYGATSEEILIAVDVGKEVRAGAATKMERFAAGFVGAPAPAAARRSCGCA